jgi:hypothetical protein
LCNWRWLQSGGAAQQIAQGDCLLLRFLKLFAPAVLVLVVGHFAGPAAAYAAALGRWTFLYNRVGQLKTN